MLRSKRMRPVKVSQRYMRDLVASGNCVDLTQERGDRREGMTVVGYAANSHGFAVGLIMVDDWNRLHVVIGRGANFFKYSDLLGYY